jgi:hypothetical protein
MAHLQKPDTSEVNANIVTNGYWVVLDGPWDVNAAINRGYITKGTLGGYTNYIYFASRVGVRKCIAKINGEALKIKNKIHKFYREMPGNRIGNFKTRKVQRH